MHKTIVISHRGNFLPEGPIALVSDEYEIPENTLEAFKRAFQKGWGIETDIRITDDGNFICLHDEDKIYSSKIIIPTLNELCKLTQNNTLEGKFPFIAFQVKRNSNPDSGLEVGRAVARKIQQYELNNSILFDTTLEEAKVLHEEFPALNLSVSVGEKNYSPTIYTPAQVLTEEFTSVYTSIWADEWKIPGSIYNKEMFRKLQIAYTGRIDVISPELHSENHPFAKDLNKLKVLWQEILSWGIASGICTDYPTKLQLLT